MVALVYSDADSTKEEWSFPNHKAGSGFILTLDYVVPSDYDTTKLSTIFLKSFMC